MPKTKRAAAQHYSPRSQRNLKRQHDVEEQVKTFQEKISIERRGMAVDESNRTRQAKMVAGGQYLYVRNLDETLAEIERRKLRIKAYEQVIADSQKEIEALQPSTSQAAERSRKQAEASRLANKLTEGDAEIDEQIERLRGLLAARSQLTAALVRLAGEIDLSARDFNSERFNALAISLPPRMQAESRRWLEWFLGMEEGRQPFEVRAKSLTFPETLAAAHYYREGDTALLTQKQCEEAQREAPHELSTIEFAALHDRPKGTEADVRSPLLIVGAH